MKKALLSLTLLSSLLFAIESNDIVSDFTLKGDEGGYVTGKDFNSASLDKNIYLMFYVDPDEKDMNEHVGPAIKKEDFNSTTFGSIACINMDATWKPNFIISSMLKSKQEEFPTTIYLKDMEKKVLKAWSFKDDSSNVIVFNKARKVLFASEGKVSPEALKTLIQTIKDNINPK